MIKINRNHGNLNECLSKALVKNEIITVDVNQESIIPYTLHGHHLIDDEDNITNSVFFILLEPISDKLPAYDINKIVNVRCKAIRIRGLDEEAKKYITDGLYNWYGIEKYYSTTMMNLF